MATTGINDSFPFTCQISRGIAAREYTKFTEMWQSACEIQENQQETEREKMLHLMHSGICESVYITHKHVAVFPQYMSKSSIALQKIQCEKNEA